MRELIRDLLAYTASLGIVTVFLVKIAALPDMLSNAPLLVREYYGHWWEVLALDWVLVGLYILAGKWIAARMGTQLYVGTAVASVLISGSFLAYFLSKPPTAAFFSRWFHKAGWGAVAYDVILVSCVALTFTWMKDLLKPPPVHHRTA
jgi:hypothetical protein